jgi:hypothetical protein
VNEKKRKFYQSICNNITRQEETLSEAVKREGIFKKLRKKVAINCRTKTTKEKDIKEKIYQKDIIHQKI